MQWDIFCRVIDNLGDIGVCWRLCADLAARGHTLRLWVDDASALTWMAPGSTRGKWSGIQVFQWDAAKCADLVSQLPPSQVWLEAFGCDVPKEFIAAYMNSYSHERGAPIDSARPVWINLEYLSAESFVERAHGLPSPVMQGPACGWTKYFFYPGLTGRTGGLLREHDLEQRQNHFDAALWLRHMAIPRRPHERLVSLFCYEPVALSALLCQFAADHQLTALLVTAGRARAAVLDAVARLTATDPAWNEGGALAIAYLPPLTQRDFDHLLWACDLNFVRGEDSLVRALWAGKPLVWQIYPQDDQAHHAKLDALLNLMAPEYRDGHVPCGTSAQGPCAASDPVLIDRNDAICAWKEFHRVWNGITAPDGSDVLPTAQLNNWSGLVKAARCCLMELGDLSSHLIRFIEKKR
ncbi:MAG: elongation factor P maturation arginine rhamnosyltransferase EarP [Rhodoferax sp.]|nr:elongation factor P maturation arginine rhamnosyltransferase EarP [Rhodoferax sp.]MCF8211074.1 elongation factor P maturation arginine rhamnosyltransferase EarP [Rhodoferax sp.]